MAVWEWSTLDLLRGILKIRLHVCLSGIYNIGVVVRNTSTATGGLSYYHNRTRLFNYSTHGCICSTYCLSFCVLQIFPMIHSSKCLESNFFLLIIFNHVHIEE